MAFTFRSEKKHDQELERLCKECNFSSKSKALIWIIENFDKIMAERDNYEKEYSRLRRDLSELRNAVKNKIEADRVLSLCIAGYE